MDLQGITFTRVHRSMLTSSIWTAPHPNRHMLRCVWVTLLLLADRHGFVYSTTPGLAAAAMVSPEEAEEALEAFRSPDKYSRSTDFGGRRLVDTEGGWFLLNYTKHSKAARAEVARQSKRDWYHREKAKRAANDTADPQLPTATGGSQPPVDESLAEPSPEPSETRPTHLVLEQNDQNTSSGVLGISSFGSPLPPPSLSPPTPPPLPPSALPSADLSINARTREGSPESEAAVDAQGVRAVWRNLDGWVPSDELVAEALVQGITRAEFDERVDVLRNGPIGGSRGVFDRDAYVRKQLPRWRTWAEEARSKAVHKPGSTGAGSGTPRQGPPWRAILEPTSKHRRYAERHGLPIDQIVRELTESGAVEDLGARRALELLGERMTKLVRERKGAA